MDRLDHQVVTIGPRDGVEHVSDYLSRADARALARFLRESNPSWMRFVVECVRDDGSREEVAS